jgi:hypothetical protein
MPYASPHFVDLTEVHKMMIHNLLESWVDTYDATGFIYF